jgi:cardiolipin synthase
MAMGWVGMTLANQLTILRICLVPLLVILLVYGFYDWGLVVFIVAGITDALDGLVARLRQERTELGTLLDPLADKLLVTSSFIVLSLPSPHLAVRIPPWIAILSISRDAGILLAVLVFNLMVARRSFPPSLLGKMTTLVHILTIVWVIGCNYGRVQSPVTDYLLGATVVFVAASGLHYLYIGKQILAREENQALE